MVMIKHQPNLPHQPYRHRPTSTSSSPSPAPARVPAPHCRSSPARASASAYDPVVNLAVHCLHDCMTKPLLFLYHYLDHHHCRVITSLTLIPKPERLEPLNPAYGGGSERLGFFGQNTPHTWLLILRPANLSPTLSLLRLEASTKGAVIIRIGFGGGEGVLYYNYNKEPPKPQILF